MPFEQHIPQTFTANAIRFYAPNRALILLLGTVFQIEAEEAGVVARIRGERERDLQRIQSEAYRQAEEARGVADAAATGIYAAAYGRGPAFYAFMKSMETLETAVDQDTLLVLTTDGDLFQYLDDPQ